MAGRMAGSAIRSGREIVILQIAMAPLPVLPGADPGSRRGARALTGLSRRDEGEPSARLVIGRQGCNGWSWTRAATNKQDIVHGWQDERGARQRPVIHWFRLDLRLGDNRALAAAAASGPVIPLYPRRREPGRLAGGRGQPLVARAESLGARGEPSGDGLAAGAAARAGG
ncbi:MAG: deoxyribodipyrimidine photo-lyase [Hyphomicrobiaceae bacterium]